MRDIFLDGPVVKTLPSNAEDAGSIPGPGDKIPHASGQLSPCATTIKPVKVKSLSRVRLFATPWGVAYQAPPSMGFSRQEYWSGLPFPSPGGLPNPGIEPGSPALQADALPSEPPGKTIKPVHNNKDLAQPK